MTPIGLAISASLCDTDSTCLYFYRAAVDWISIGMASALAGPDLTLHKRATLSIHADLWMSSMWRIYQLHAFASQTSERMEKKQRVQDIWTERGSGNRERSRTEKGAEQGKEQNRARQRNRERSGTEKGNGGSTWTRKNKEITKTSLGRSRAGTAAEAYPKQYNHDNDK